MGSRPLITARNEVGARYYFHRHLWFCSQGGSVSVHARIHPRDQAGTPWDQAGTLLGPGRHPPGTKPPPPDQPSPPGTGRHPPQDQVPPQTKQAPPSPLGPGTTPQDQAPSLDQAPPPPRAEHTGRYGERAGGMHPTGMQSCWSLFLLSIIM